MVEDVFGILGNTLAGTFHVEEVIAEGGFGVVYRAEHVAFRAPVALKCLKIPGTISPSQSELFVENFREEAEILFHLSAQIPEVVRPLHADAMTLDDGTFVPYIAMEWVEGRPLDSIIIMRDDDGLPPLAIRKVIKMLTPIAHALGRAHHFQVPGGAIVSVTHCDLKPENILITERDNPIRARILDFGIAKARDTMRQNVGRITDSEQNRPFTPSYGAPEQWVPKRYGQTGPWTDVWGLALTLVECLTGNPPIDGDMHAMMGTALDRSRRPTPRNEGAAISDLAEEVFERALAVDPRQRYETIEDFWTALEHAEGLPSSFERARRRRQDPTYDDLSDQLPPSGVDEFDLELEGDELLLESAPPSAPYREPAPFGDPAPYPEPPPRRGPPLPHGGPPPGDPYGPPSSNRGDGGYGAPPSPRAAALDSMPPFDSVPPAAVSSKSSAGEFFLETSSAPPMSSDPPPMSGDSFDPISGPIDLDLSTRSEPPAASKPRVAVTSGSFPRPDLNESGSFPGVRPPPSGGKLGSVGGVHTAVEETRGLRQQLQTPVILVATGITLTLLDMILSRAMGGTLSLGPVRLRWIAVVVVGIGVVLAFWNLLGDQDE